VLDIAFWVGSKPGGLGLILLQALAEKGREVLVLFGMKSAVILIPSCIYQASSSSRCVV
jgi:hypothetical protein